MDGFYKVPISKFEFLMLSAFKECVEDKENGRVHERELQEHYSKRFGDRFPVLGQININTIRNILYRLQDLGILTSWQCIEGNEWELHASERGCTFELFQDDDEEEE